LNKGGFTLIEVVVASILIAIIGISLIKLSSANIEGVEHARKERYDLYSLVLFRISEMGDIKDYAKIKDIEVPSLKVEIKEEDVLTQEYDISSMNEDLNGSVISIVIYKESVKIGENGLDYFRLR